MTDPIADMLIRIKNSQEVKQDTVDIPHSKMKESMTKIFVEEGYVKKFEVLKRMGKKHLRLTLKYNQKRAGVIRGLKRVSTPGRRIYSEAKSLSSIQAGFGTVIISTSKGLLTDDAARLQKLGGEVLCYIW
ncbi:30S ribosomal protein S8 [Candidatus Saganbacteria bacterium CG08_land_8_20_14_0_20_45_16]|uniref:Small ribosomal subunit protein uS8 n=1 Tax=Candidatus Saganbacteria bacterium CG08_land_8_20_14_0_20_45_16 TaxID=2014293 RepID=A0A2H0XXF7_UNCSA|nr:MAG: 30S ribosomal protein S8 [Candidatus Saganbacteria bacterium CG08_land_8_20_14_0_20_45_16]